MQILVRRHESSQPNNSTQSSTQVPTEILVSQRMVPEFDLRVWSAFSTRSAEVSCIPT